MPKLEPTAQIQLNFDTVANIVKHYGLKLKSYRLAKGGIENTTAMVKTIQGENVLRIYRRNKKPFSHIQQEVRFMEYLKNHGLPVPMVYKNLAKSNITRYKTNGTTWVCILMECMKGIHQNSYPTSLLKSYARTQAAMHLLGIKFAQKEKKNVGLTILREDWFSKNIDLEKLTQAEVKGFLKRTTDFTVKLDPKLNKGFNHLDFDHQNVLVLNNKLSAILDFDDLTFSPSIVCLGNTLWDVLYMTPTRQGINKVRLYLQEYQKIRPIKLRELQCLQDILLFRNYSIGALIIMFEGENASSIKKIFRLEKLLKTLQPAKL